jgi:hypothetical protein
MHGLLPGLDGHVSLSYQIALLGCSVEVDVCPPAGAQQLSISMPEPTLITQFRDHYRTILLDHALAQCKAKAVGFVNHQAALADVDDVFAQLKRTSSDQEYDTTLAMQGKGGVLLIRVQKKNLLRLRYEIARQKLYLVFALLIGSVVVVWFCAKGLWPIGIYIGFIPLGVIGASAGKIKELSSEVTEYERNSSTRFTTTGS